MPGPPQTNNRGELYAVLKAIEQAPGEKTLQLRSDSEYAIRCLCHWAPHLDALGWVCTNGDILRSVCELIKRRTAPIHFYWVKGHDGHPQNERCDELATSAADGDALLVDEGAGGF